MDTRQNFSGRGKLSFEEKKFVGQVLAIEGQIIYDEQTKAIQQGNLNRAGIMANHRGFSVKGAGSFANGWLEIHFVKYLRFHDMTRDRLPGKTTIFSGKYEERATKGRRVQYHLYNRIVYGRMNAIANRLMYGFTEQVKQQLAEEYQIPV